MQDRFQNIRAVGFDLDGTLYAQTPEMDEKIVELFAQKILERRPDLKTLEYAREFSQEKYRELESRKKTLELVGYENAGEIMEEIFRQADGSQFLGRDDKLVKLLEDIRSAKEYMYIVTTAPQEEAKKKLEKLGVDEALFNVIICGDSPIIAQKPKSEVVFHHMIEMSGIPAENHVYIGDREKSDVLAPKAVSMKTIAVANEISSADAQVAQIYDIRAILL